MRKISFAGYRFPPEVINQAIWLYLRFTLSFRDIEELAERGIAVSHETVTVVNVNFPGPSVGGNTETHCRIANVVMAALAPGLKERSAATDGASHSNFLFGGADAKRDEFFCC